MTVLHSAATRNNHNDSPVSFCVW